MHKTIIAIFFGLILLSSETVLSQTKDMVSLPPPSQYGNLIINRVSEKSGSLPVTFSHWLHRTKHTCRVCHLELEFEMKVNATEITEEKNKNGQFCGACHNGEIAFGHTKDNCKKCHNGDITFGSERFKELASLLSTQYGNNINWVDAVTKKLIEPKQTLCNKKYAYKQPRYKKLLTIEPEWADFPKAVFPHGAHIEWLDCANCHPDIFNIKKKATKHLAMNYIYEGKFCGQCHLNVAFPVNNCKGCHPDLEKK